MDGGREGGVMDIQCNNNIDILTQLTQLRQLP